MRIQNPLIIGAGPAGCAAAIVLARGGAEAIVLERQAATGDALCGGFLSWETLSALQSIGIGDLRGHPISRLRLFAAGRVAEAALPAGAIGVSRHRLDSVMQGVATSMGAEIRFGTAIREICGATVRSDAGEIEADTLFVATGKHDVRGLTRVRDGDPTLGLRVKLAPAARLHALIDDAIELHLFDRGYVGLLLQEDGQANLCLAVRKSKLAEAGGKPAALLAQIAQGTPLADRLAFLDPATDIGAIANVPYGWRTTETSSGVYRLGDQAAVIPSLAGEGVGIAIASGISAADAWLRGGGMASVAWQRDFARRTARPVRIAKILWERAERDWSAKLGTQVIAALPGIASVLARATRISL